MSKDLTTGNSTSNEDDTYLRCPSSKATIHRYNKDTLTVYFGSTGIANNREKELSEMGIKLTVFQDGDGERTYHFAESDLPIVTEVLKPIVYGKNKSPKVRKVKSTRQLSEGEKDILRNRLEKARMYRNQK